ncbi:MAG: glycosyltransferase family 25 protein [Bdellovibrionales bacterium]|nr:glycosyltransferase family 25 protein [Bdellovibrionales bacterium]
MDLNKTLRSQFNTQIENAYIIRISGNRESVRLSERCAASCEKSGMPYQFFEGIDGTSGQLVVPPSLQSCTALTWLKAVDHELSVTEIACVLSHFALWVKCLELDQPIVILEHDAIMVKAFRDFQAFNQIIYLGGSEQVTKGWPVLPIPPHATLNHNYHFICRAHAYAIDPAMAKNLVSHVVKFGVHEALDIMMRADLFSIVQMGLYAYDEGGETTIVDRKKTPAGIER